MPKDVRRILDQQPLRRLHRNWLEDCAWRTASWPARRCYFGTRAQYISLLKRSRPRADARFMDRRGLTTGVLVSLPFTLSVALLCTTTGADAFYAPLAVATMLVVLLVPMGLQIACGVRAFVRGGPLLRPLASVTASYLTGAFATMLAADAIVRLSGVKGAALPAGLGGAFAEWVGIMLSLASVPALSGLVVVVGVAAGRSRA